MPVLVLAGQALAPPGRDLDRGLPRPYSSTSSQGLETPRRWTGHGSRRGRSRARRTAGTPCAPRSALSSSAGNMALSRDSSCSRRPGDRPASTCSRAASRAVRTRRARRLPAGVRWSETARASGPIRRSTSPRRGQAIDQPDRPGVRQPQRSGRSSIDRPAGREAVQRDQRGGSRGAVTGHARPPPPASGRRPSARARRTRSALYDSHIHRTPRRRRGAGARHAAEPPGERAEEAQREQPAPPPTPRPTARPGRPRALALQQRAIGHERPRACRRRPAPPRRGSPDPRAGAPARRARPGRAAAAA